RAHQEAYRSRGDALSDKEPEQPGPSELSDSAEQQAGRVAWRRLARRVRTDRAVFYGLQRSGREDRRAASETFTDCEDGRAGIQSGGEGPEHSGDCGQAAESLRFYE